MRNGLLLAALVVVGYMVFKGGGKDAAIGTGQGLAAVPHDPGRAVAF